MRIHFGTDHAGFELKNALVEHLRGQGYEVVDHGAHEYDSQDDYPAYCIAAAEAVKADPGSLGVVIGGSGNGEQLAANCVPGIRAILAWSPETAHLGREHNNAQVVAVGGRMHTQAEAFAIVDEFVKTPFSEDPRHIRRVDEMLAYQAKRDGAASL
ncbi:MAG: ribose-5-phosphate isomerase [Cellulomonadaceae bacterium]|jgi:ribose 5-phosphate isomerase B|nr:ribose-5-phosphate isomerase [Cellulomonadaceae bacterium]